MSSPSPRRPPGPPAMLTMYSPVSALVRPGTVTVPLEATIRETLRRLEATRADLVVVVDASGRTPLGVFTLEDLVRRVALPSADLEQPIATVMTSGLITVAPQGTIHHAVLEMARHGVRHLVVVDAQGALAGVVSIDSVEGAVRGRFSGAVADRNVAAARAAFDYVMHERRELSGAATD